MKTTVNATMKRIAQLASAIALNLFVVSGAFAASTTLTFDDLASGSLVGSQYSGVTFANPVVIQSQPGMPAQSGTQLAYAEEGIIDITFSSSVGSVQKVSGYVSSGIGAMVSVYDSSNALIQQQMVLAGSNVFFSITSATYPIAKVYINGSGDLLGLDTFTYEIASTIPICEAITQNLYNSVSAVPLSSYKNSKTASNVRASLLKKIATFDQSLKSDVSNKSLLLQLASIRSIVDCSLKPSPEKTAIMQMIDDLIAKTKANLC